MKFTYDAVVRVKANAPIDFRPGQTAWIIAMFEHDNAPQ